MCYSFVKEPPKNREDKKERVFNECVINLLFLFVINVNVGKIKVILREK